MTQVIEKAKQRLAEVEAEVRKIRQFIATYEEFSTKSEVPIKDSNDAEMACLSNADSKKVVGDKPRVIVQTAKAVIRESGRPMTRSQLVDAIESKGLVVGGADKGKNLGTVLWRSKEFENIDGQGYWPAEDGEWLDI